ncbi:MAG: VOC family protein [Dehalococcoidia bacterium]
MIRPNLWFDTEAEEAARYYVGIFRNAKMGAITRYSEVGREFHGKPAGSVLAVGFELDGQEFVAINGGPVFTFNEAISLEVVCADQAEVDYYWERLGAGGDPAAQQCRWLKDRYGVSWQVVPAGWEQMLNDPDQAKVDRAMEAMFQMKKLDIAELQRAFEGRA